MICVEMWHITPLAPLYYSMKRTALTLASNLIIVLVIAALAITAVVAVGDASPAFAPITRGNEENTVVLTFNVYLGDEYVRAIMDVLRQNGIIGTFFLGGSWVKKHADTCRMLVDAGHCIGSHGYSHLDHSRLNYAQNLAELEKAQAAIHTACGVTTTLFAPPSGAYGQDMLKACQDMGYRVIMWTKDTIDWRDQDVDVLVGRATRNMQSGDIILMHPTAATVEALQRIIEAYMAAGFRFVTAESVS